MVSRDNSHRFSVQRLCFDALLMAISMIFSYLESLVPVYFGAPGIKLGLANLIVLFVVFQKRKASIIEAFLINLGRILLTGFLFGNLFTILYSFAGAVTSILLIRMLNYVPLLSTLYVPLKSAICGIGHNLAQLLVAFWVLRSPSLWYYLPVLMLGGLVCGLITGALYEALKPYLVRLRR